MRLTRADRELLGVCRTALNRKYGRMAEVGSRKAEVAYTLMREYPKLIVHLCGDWNDYANLPWHKQQSWSEAFRNAQLGTEFEPPRRLLHRGDPDNSVFQIAQYSLSVCCFSDDRHARTWDSWYSRVASSGTMCGVRSPTSDASLREWTADRKVQVTFTKRIWWIEKPQ